MKVAYSSDPGGNIPIDPKTATLKVGDVIFISMNGGKPSPTKVLQTPPRPPIPEE